MAKTKTPIKLRLSPNQVRGIDLLNPKNKPSGKDLAAFGVSMDAAILPEVSSIFGNSHAMDAASVPLQTTASISNPVQFFQHWAPKAVEVITAARKIDDILGRTIAGSFEDEEIVTTFLERTGRARPYTDTANIPLASWNQNFITRNIVRFEEGFEIGYLESMRASRMRIDDHAQKAAAVADGLAIELNEIGFYGYANGANNTYGLLNEPSLAPYQSVATGASNETSWSQKTFNEITADIITAVAQLVNQMAGNFDPRKDAFTLTLSLASTQWLNTMNELGTKSVSQWLQETYPNIRVEAAPQLDGANGGSNVFYLHIDEVKDVKTFEQYVQDVLRLIGVEKKAKVVVEDYAAATAGVILQYPIAVVRYSGI